MELEGKIREPLYDITYSRAGSPLKRARHYNMEILLGPIVITSSLLNSLLMLNKVGRLFNVSRLNLKFLSLSAERGSLES